MDFNRNHSGSIRKTETKSKNLQNLKIRIIIDDKVNNHDRYKRIKGVYRLARKTKLE